MSSVMDLMLELLKDLLKEEWEKRKQIEKELGESNKLTTELISKIHDLETDIVLESGTQVIANIYRHGYIECDDANGFNEVDTLSIWHAQSHPQCWLVQNITWRLGINGS